MAAWRARVFDSLMDLGLTIGLALLLTALTLRSGANGNAIPGFLLAPIAGIYAIYLIQDEDPRSQILFAWAICFSGILSAYVGRRVKSVSG
jgi:4-hydroxybenzoate polyprenyltransferase